MLKLEISCSYHQKDGEPKEIEITLDTISEHARQEIKKHLESQGWVVQYNGGNMDTYCSKKCAE